MSCGDDESMSVRACALGWAGLLSGYQTGDSGVGDSKKQRERKTGRERERDFWGRRNGGWGGGGDTNITR